MGIRIIFLWRVVERKNELYYNYIISVWIFGFRILLIKDLSYFKVLEISWKYWSRKNGFIISMWVFGFRILLIKDLSYFKVKVLEMWLSNVDFWIQKSEFWILLSGDSSYFRVSCGEKEWLLYQCEFLDLEFY